MSESPLYRRQLVRSGVDTAAAALANEVLTVGDDYAAVGKIIGKLFEQGAKNKEGVDKAEEQENQIYDQAKDNADKARENADKVFGDKDKEVTKLNSDDVLNDQQRFEEIEKRRAQLESEAKGGGGLASYQQAWDTDLEGVRSKYKSFQDYASDMATRGAVTEHKRLWAQQNLAQGETYNEDLHVKQYDEWAKSNPIKRLSPLSRTASAASLLAGMEARQMGMGSTFNSKISDKSQYVEGKTYVEKEQYLRVPSYLQGTSGAAALEGFNIGIEADNYRKQVEADLADFREDKWKGLVQEAQQESLMDKSTVAMLKQYKNQFADAMKAEDPGKRIDMLANIKSGMANVYQADAAKTKMIEGFKAAMPNAALSLMSPQEKDEYVSLANGKNIGMIIGEDGQVYLAGQTNNGMPYRKKLNDLVSGDGLPKVPQKADTFGIIDGIADSIEKQKLFRETVDADGIIRKVPLSKEELKQQFDFEFEQAINDNGLKSLAASLPMYQGPRAYQRWAAGERRESNDPLNNRNILKQAMTDMLHHRLSGYMSQTEEKEGAGIKSKYRQQEINLRAAQQRLTNQEKADRKALEEKNESGSGGSTKGGTTDKRTAAQKNADAISESRSLFADNIIGIFSEGLDINQATAAGEPAYDLAKAIPGITDAYPSSESPNEDVQAQENTLVLTDKDGNEAFYIDLSDYRKAKQKLIEIQAKYKFKPETAGLRTGKQVALPSANNQNN